MPVSWGSSNVRHIIPISGKDSMATAIVMLANEPGLPYEFVHHVTGWDLPEVTEWFERVEARIGTIVKCGDDLTEIVTEQGMLPSRHRRFCTKYAKIFPMRDWLGKSEATLYLGLRADESDRISGMTPSRRETYRFPLQEQSLSIRDVWALVASEGLLPPQFIWPWMVDRVRQLGGTKPVDMPEWEWNTLFSGRSRPNCDICFNQRQYEWIWLHETHPEAFQRGVDLELSTQHASSFKLIGKDKPLDSLLAKAEAIKERRARWIAGFLERRRQGELFNIIQPDDLVGTSCGLFCGK